MELKPCTCGCVETMAVRYKVGPFHHEIIYCVNGDCTNEVRKMGLTAAQAKRHAIRAWNRGKTSG